MIHATQARKTNLGGENMTIGLLDVDSHNYPNLALMKLSAWHKARGDGVEMWDGFKHYDVVYKAKVFDETYSHDESTVINAERVVIGGTGYRLDSRLPDGAEHITPDYSLYNIKDAAYGFLTRGCPRACPFCIVAEKEGRQSLKVADIGEWWHGQKEIELLDPNTIACRDHIALLKQLADTGAWVNFSQGVDCRLLTEDNIKALNQVKTRMLHFAWDLMAETDRVLAGLQLYKRLGKVPERRRRVYVLVNYDTTQEENLYRIYKLRELEFDPFVMVFNKPTAPPEIKKLQRWVNNKFVFRVVKRFEDYDTAIKGSIRTVTKTAPER